MGRPAKVTREQVLAAAHTLFAERGFEAVTLADIGAHVGLSPAAVLRHEPSKDALFVAAMRTINDGELPIPIQFLETLSGKEDPVKVLRRLAESSIPIMEQRIGSTIALWMRSNGLDVAAPPLPFDPGVRPTPPERALSLVASYFERATRHRRVQVDDPLSAALGFMGALQAYVWFHRVLRAIDPPLPLPRYLDQLIAVWCRTHSKPTARKRKRR